MHNNEQHIEEVINEIVRNCNDLFMRSHELKNVDDYFNEAKLKLEELRPTYPSCNIEQLLIKAKEKIHFYHIDANIRIWVQNFDDPNDIESLASNNLKKSHRTEKDNSSLNLIIFAYLGLYDAISDRPKLEHQLSVEEKK